jgi:hypothetical protein
MLIKPERIKPLTSFTRCTRYQWNFQKQDPGQRGRLVKLVAQLQDRSYLILGQGCALAPLEWAEIDSPGFHGPRPRLTIPAPKSRPCLWMGRGALRIPNGPTDLASRGGQPYDE